MRILPSTNLSHPGGLLRSTTADSVVLCVVDHQCFRLINTDFDSANAKASIRVLDITGYLEVMRF